MLNTRKLRHLFGEIQWHLRDGAAEVNPSFSRARRSIVRCAGWKARLCSMFPPERIVCLTEETVETLYLLGEQDRIVGISGYCVRPAEARREKPRVSAFTSADIPKILNLKPDLVLSFSDLQADIVAALIRHGVAVHAFNQRTVAEILDMIRMLGAMTGASDPADRLTRELTADSDDVGRAFQLKSATYSD
jgi:ABC-type Fe3+-hydroxamate transport system substrate-binding protein